MNLLSKHRESIFKRYISAFMCLSLILGTLSMYPVKAFAAEALKLDPSNSFSAPEPGSTPGTTRITGLVDAKQISGATKWVVDVQDNGRVLNSNEQPGGIDYTAGMDVPIKPNQHLILMATDYDNKVKAYADIQVKAEMGNYQISAPALIASTNYSFPVQGGEIGTTKITDLRLPDDAMGGNWYYAVQNGQFNIPRLNENTVTLGYKKYNADNSIAVTAGQHMLLVATDSSNQIKAYADLTISGGQIRQDSPTLTIATIGGVNTPITTNDIKGKEITITLSGGEWADDIDKKADILLSGFTASSQSNLWDNLKSQSTITSIDSKTIKIKLPDTFPTGMTSYNITNNQVISISLANSLFKNSVSVTAYPNQFTITAAKQAIISGDVAKSLTDADIRVGGKKIVIDLINDTWNPNILTNTSMKKALIESFFYSDDENWKNYLNEIENGTKFSFSGGYSELTIELPTLPDFKITSNDNKATIHVSNGSNDIPSICVVSKTNVPKNGLSSDTVVSKVMGSLTIESTSTIIGTPTVPTSEADIVAGGKTIYLTLTEYTWADDIATNPIKKKTLITSLVDSDSDISSDIDKSPYNTIQRISPTELKITLPVMPNYRINGNNEKFIQLKDLAASGMGIIQGCNSEKDIALSITGYRIIPVTAEISGTIKSTVSPTKQDIVKGGRTISINITGDTWAQDISTNPVKRELLIQSLTATASNNPSEWAEVQDALRANPSKISRTSNTTVTITLPPVSGYDLGDPSNSSSLKQQKIDLYLQPGLLTKTLKTISIQEAFSIENTSDQTQTPSDNAGEQSVSISTGISGGSSIKEQDVRNGNQNIVITLVNASFVQDAVSDSAKRKSLLGGLTPDGQTTEWAKIKAALDKLPVTSITRDSDKQVTINLPKVSDYDITWDQKVNIKIVKSLIQNGTADLTSKDPVVIEVIKYGKFDAVLLNPYNNGLSGLIKTFSPRNVYVMVPKRYIKTIEMTNSSILTGTTPTTSTTSMNVITADVYTDMDVDTVMATNGYETRVATKYTVVSGKKLFNIGFTNLKDGTDITFSMWKNGNRLQKDVPLKVPVMDSAKPYVYSQGGFDKDTIYTLHDLILSNSKAFTDVLMKQGYTLDELTVSAPQ